MKLFSFVKKDEGSVLLEKVQLEAARIVTGLSSYASRESLYLEPGWKTLQKWWEIRKLNLFIGFIMDNLQIFFKMCYLPW